MATADAPAIETYARIMLTNFTLTQTSQSWLAVSSNSGSIRFQFPGFFQSLAAAPTNMPPFERSAPNMLHTDFARGDRNTRSSRKSHPRAPHSIADKFAQHI